MFVPYGIKRIGNYASVNNEKIHNIYFSDSSINSIGAFAFRNCINLKHVDFAWELNCIQNSAFEDCEILTHIELPQFLQSIGNRAFRGCNEIKTVLVPSSVRKMGRLVFGVDWCVQGHRDSLTGIYTDIYPQKIDIYCEEWTPVDTWEKDWDLAHNNIELHKWCKFKYDDEGIPDFDWDDEEEISEQTVIETIQIEFADFVVKTNVFKCNLNHAIEQIQAKINIMQPDGGIIEQCVSAGYCKECNCYFILQTDFERLRNYGVLLCQQITEEAYRKNGLSILNGDQLKPESLLHQSGYNVSAAEDLSSEQRHEILRRVVDNGLYSVSGICSHLDWLIARNNKITNRDMSSAISKWKEDRAFISSYSANTQRKVQVKSIKTTK